tara:strand:+ start:177 stop:617 length:441 start_codon:yes stop_codon:yes gene_type:complete
MYLNTSGFLNVTMEDDGHTDNFWMDLLTVFIVLICIALLFIKVSAKNGKTIPALCVPIALFNVCVCTLTVGATFALEKAFSAAKKTVINKLNNCKNCCCPPHAKEVESDGGTQHVTLQFGDQITVVQPIENMVNIESASIAIPMDV